MAQTVQTDDALVIDAPPVRLSFRWDGLRWTHELFAAGTLLARSVEWEPGRDDPSTVVSPSFQQISAQNGPEGARALLVGQWGRHHGSAVFDLTEDATGVAIEGDVAVRTREGLRSLASTYTVHRSSGDLVDAGPGGILWALDDPPGGVLRFEPVAPARVGLAEAGRRLTRAQALGEVVPGAATQRLRYRWRWVRPQDINK
jgi:hypothetical protein